MEKSRVSKATENMKNGHNCCQAVVCAYCDLLGMDAEDAFRIAEGFGGGIAGTRQTCGAVTAMVMLAGMKISSGAPEKGMTKPKTVKMSQQLMKKFQEKNHSIICGELMQGPDGKKLRSCQGCVLDAARFVEDNLFPGQFEPYEGPEE